MSKKIGILTFHRAINHGAVLQCYALYKTLEKLGHDVIVIDYRQPYIEKLYRPNRKIIISDEVQKVLQNPRWIPGYVFKILFQRYKTRNFCKRLYKELRFTPCVECAEDFPDNMDAIVVGSDQVWANYCTNGIDKIYYGEFAHGNAKIIGYAISSNLESLIENGNKKLKRLCKNFNSISFREEEISRYLQEKVGISSTVVLDPTLLINREEWDRIAYNVIIKKPKKYILTHFLNDDFNRRALNDNINYIAKRKGSKIIELDKVAHSPEEFISWIKDAEHVITSSFHATVFSIIYKKHFLALRTNNGRDIRYINLLKKLKLSSQLTDPHGIDEKINRKIEYNQTEQILTKEQKLSIKYIKDCL